MKKRHISIIIPCYNESSNIAEMYRRILRTFQATPRYAFEIIFIDNASTDNSVKNYSKISKKDRRVKVIIMSRNFGSPQPSFLAGLSYASGDAAILLHGDIQDPPELIPSFIEKWEEGYKVVYGVRKKRNGYNIIWNLLYRGFYYILHKLSYIDIPLNAGEFSLIDRTVINELLNIDEYDYYVRCLRAFVGFRQTGIEYTREARKNGKSTETLFSGFWWAKTMIINYSMKPLEIISKFAFIIMSLSFLFLVINVFMVLYIGNSPPGIPTIIVLILFLGGIQLLSLSIIAEYIAKIFLEVKHRPRYIIEKTINVKQKLGNDPSKSQ